MIYHSNNKMSQHIMHYKIYKIVVSELQTNCYILAETTSNLCAIIDPGAEADKIKAVLESQKLRPSFIINTHGHADHIMANHEFNIPVYIHKNDFEFLQTKTSVRLLEDRDKIELGDLQINIIHTPGHTPGGICLLCSDALFSGDTLFASGIGRTDLPYGDEKQLISAIKNKLFVLNDSVKVYPGHGPETTIGREKIGD